MGDHSRSASTELGLKELSPRHYASRSTWNGNPTVLAGSNEWNTVCEKFVYASYDGSMTAHQFMAERLSFFEIAFRELYTDLQDATRSVAYAFERKPTSGDGTSPLTRGLHAAPRSPGSGWLQQRSQELRHRYASAAEEFNTRIRQAGYLLHYHNGCVQIASDQTLASEVEQPFWRAVSEPIWDNVDVDMKEALDRRDSGQRDPAFYAARALESTIKIISDQRSWTHGGERGPRNYLDNLGSAKNGSFIVNWEKEALERFFAAVRNPFAHGPGSDRMPKLTSSQTDWAIASCMAWIKTLIQRT